MSTAKLPISGFVWANELDLQDERGDKEDDWNNLATRYSLIGGFANALLGILRSELDTKTAIHFPAFTPDHGALAYVDMWRQAAERHDVIDFHAYDSLDKIQRQYQGYRNAFPDSFLALTEWHCRGDVEEERRVLQWLAELKGTDRLFDAAYRFIYRWDNAASWWDKSFEVESRSDMMTLFMNPPQVESSVEPTPPTEQEPPMPESPEYQFGFKDEADRLGADVVGEPLAGEEPPDAFTFQMTSKGLMIYSKTANVSHFIAAPE